MFRPIKLTILFISIVYSTYLFPSNSVLNISTNKPETESTLTLTYGGFLAKKGGTKMSCIFLYLDSNYFIEKNVSTKLIGDSLIGKIEIPSRVSYCIVTIRNKNDYDNNDGNGFGFNIYKSGFPVKGTFFVQGYSKLLNDLFFDGKNDATGAVKLMEKEFDIYPELAKNQRVRYLDALYTENRDNKKVFELANKYLKEIITTGKDERYAYDYIQIVSGDNRNKSDSLLNLISLNYPQGHTSFKLKKWKLDYYTTNMPDSAILFYKTILKEYHSILDLSHYQDITNLILTVYSNKLDLENFDRTIDKFLKKDSSHHSILWSAHQYKSIAEKLLKTPNTLNDALKYSIKSLSAFKQADSLSYEYGKALNIYAAVLSKQDKVKQAILVMEKAIALTDTINREINQSYVEYLIHEKEFYKANKVCEKIITSNFSNDIIDSLYHVSFINEYKNDYNFMSRLANLKEFSLVESVRLIKKKMINLPAPDFKLRDLEGNFVRLFDLRNQIVVIDFWASWCGPCIRSFPDMQKTKNKLKGKNVEFLFINTFEREMEVQRMDQICKTLTSKGFDFRVLLDEKSGNDFETAKAYKVQSIPTKFIIDRNGNMRYRSEGFSGDDTFIEELETVIDIIDTPESFDMKK